MSRRAPKGAKSLKGVKGNLKFIINYKMWATLIVFSAGILIGDIFDKFIPIL